MDALPPLVVDNGTGVSLAIYFTICDVVELFVDEFAALIFDITRPGLPIRSVYDM